MKKKREGYLIFYLLFYLYIKYNRDLLKNYLPALVNSILRRLQTKKKESGIVFDKFTRNFTVWVNLFFTLDRLGSPDVLIQVFDSMQPG